MCQVFCELLAIHLLGGNIKNVTAKEQRRHEKKKKKTMDKWHKEHPFDLQKILDSKGAKGKQNEA